MEYFSYGEKEILHLKKRDKKLGAAMDATGMIAREASLSLWRLRDRSGLPSCANLYGGSACS